MADSAVVGGAVMLMNADIATTGLFLWLGIIVGVVGVKVISQRRRKRPGPYPLTKRERDALPCRYTDEYIIGWRAWRVFVPRPAKVRLASCFTGFIWPPGQNADTATSDIPMFGIHAYFEREKARRLGAMQFGLWVYGTVALSGEVIRYPKGYTAQFAYPLHLYVPDFSMEPEYHYLRQMVAIELRNSYGCEVELEDETPLGKEL